LSRWKPELLTSDGDFGRDTARGGTLIDLWEMMVFLTTELDGLKLDRGCKQQTVVILIGPWDDTTAAKKNPSASFSFDAQRATPKNVPR
jgi:hypothetical protein